MKDTPDEIASIMNLILPLGNKNQLPTGSNFINKYLDKQGENLYTVKENKIPQLKNKFKGRVSYIKSMQSSVQKNFLGTKIGSLNHLTVYPTTMSKHQTKAYINAVKLDSEGGSGVHYNARQSSMFVFPDNSYGQEKNKGFNKYVSKKSISNTFVASKLTNKKPIFSYKLDNEFIKLIKGKNNEETLINLKKYSCKYASVIESILNSKNKLCFVYSELVTGSGSILFAKILELFTINGKNFTETLGKDTTPGIRYGLLTFKTAGTKQIQKIINTFNNPNNMQGNIIKVLIGSRVVSEGVSFYNIQEEYILTPWFNYSETDQVIARGSRLGSHKALIDNGISPVLNISLLVAIPKQKTLNLDIKGIDLDMYETSENKDISIQRISRLMMESAFDCSLTYFRNHNINNNNGKRDCEYQLCDYECDGVNMNYVQNGLPLNDLDYSTYEIYYINSKVNEIRKKLYNFFKKYNKLTIKKIIEFFDEEYTDEEIRNSLKKLIDASNINLSSPLDGDTELSFDEYKKYYLTSVVDIIIYGIEYLFIKNFRINFNDIINYFSTYNKFEILTSLKKIINENIIIKNKYGFNSYLREENNIYFLVNNLAIKSDIFSEYYTKNPIIKKEVNQFEYILNEIQTELMPEFINKLCKITNINTFSKLIKALPEKVHEILIEAAILSKKEGIIINEKIKPIRKLILEYFVNYIYKVEDVWISSKLNEGENLRCLVNKKWEDCNENYDENINTLKVERKDILETNPWGYYGKYNPEKDTFNIVNVIEQQKKAKEDLDIKTEKLSKLVLENKITEEDKKIQLENYKKDHRHVFSGLRCSSWDRSMLRRIAIQILKLDIPISELNKNKVKEEKLRSQVLEKNANLIYTEEELLNFDINEIKRIFYWLNKTIKELCEGIKEWFANTKWKEFDMLIPDKNIGGYGNKKKEKEDKKENIFKILTIIPQTSPDIFKLYIKKIEQLMFECFDVKKYKLDLNKKWILILVKKKIAGILTIDNNIIQNLCVSKLFRKKGLSKLAIQTAISDISNPLDTPILLVNNKDKNYSKIIKMYTEYGFIITKNDNTITTMEFKFDK